MVKLDPESVYILAEYASFLLYLYGDTDGAITMAQKALSIMDLSLARSTLATAYYTKWALMPPNPKKPNQGQDYFDKAWALYPYPEAVIDTVSRYEFTRTTAIRLQRWLIDHPTGDSYLPQ